jgi:hypothetical protein
VIQLHTEFIGSLVVPAVVTVELGFRGRLVGFGVFQALVDGGHGGLDALEAFFDKVKTFADSIKALVDSFLEVINALISQVEAFIKVLVELIEVFG